jgi:multisubunit Na+/H+ antiporter MnhF subunit
MSAAGFIVAAVAMLTCLLPTGIVLVRGDLAEALVGYEFITGVAVMVFALLAEGFGRPSLFEFPVLLAALLYGSGLVFARALRGWL